MKSSSKLLFRMFYKHKSRLIALILIVIVSVGFISGVASITENNIASLDEYYIKMNTPDIIIKSTNKIGFTNQEIENYEKKLDSKMMLSQIKTFDIIDDEDIYRLYYTDSLLYSEILEGRMPINSNEILAERSTQSIKKKNIGDKVLIRGIEYTICGIVKNSLYFSKEEEASVYKKNSLARDNWNEEYEFLTGIYYIPDNDMVPITELHVSIEHDHVLFDDDYESMINNYKEYFKSDNTYVLTLYENFSNYSLYSYSIKVIEICVIFIIFFILVTCLVVLSTMTRLLEEERGQIACMKTIGYSFFKIMNKYLLFAFISSSIGAILAYFVGFGLTGALYVGFGSDYDMPKMSLKISYHYYLISVLIILSSVLLVTFYTGIKMINKKPADLLKPTAPKAGKKILMERIGFIWKRLSFKYKSSFRNVFRYVKHFFMTVISIMGSTVLVLCGLGLLDVITNVVDSYGSLILVSIALLVFAGLLTSLVIYNLTNINISERSREIATLMVLGYYDGEVSMYIFREIFIMSVIGAILGVPCGYLLLDYAFGVIDMGSASNVHWYSWILGPIITLLFTFIVALLLYRKIIKTDMNESLKINE